MTQFPVRGCQIVTPRIHSDQRGSLIALEPATGVPFEIKRTFFIYGTPEGIERGFHAHRTAEQLLVCVAGGCTVTLDNGVERAEVRLDDPSTAVAAGPLIWTEIRNFTPDAVLLVLASAPYEESDYVHDYGRFRELVDA